MPFASIYSFGKSEDERAKLLDSDYSYEETENSFEFYRAPNFSYISRNWRGKLLVSHEVIVKLIAAATTNKGLTVKCQLDTKNIPRT